MAWNASNASSQAASAPAKKPSAKSPNMLRGAIVGGAVILVAVVALYFISGEEEPAEQKDKSGSTIAEVKPDLAEAKDSASGLSESKHAVEKPYWELDSTNGFSECMIEKWKQMRRPAPRMTNDYFIVRKREPFEIFDTRAENEIAMLLTMEPGSMLVGSPEYDDGFKKEFIESCKVPIVTSASDDEYTRNLKQLMKETKIELMNQINEGGDICKIMAESRNEMQRLGLLKQSMEDMLRDGIDAEAQSEEDIDDAIAAVNKVLEEKGMAPISISPITKRGIMRRLGIRKEYK